MSKRDEHIAEIENLKRAIKKTKSPYAKRDFEKAIKRKQRELWEYDRWHRN